MIANIIKILVLSFLLLISLTRPNQAADIKKGAGVGNMIVTSFRLRNLVLEDYAIATSPVVNHTDNFIRSNNIDQPGCYLIKPRGNILTVEADKVSFLKSMLKEYISDSYYDSSVLDYANYIFLPLQNRDEFYFDVYINDVHFLFSGWYGKFTHIIVFTDFDSMESFISQAHKYFKLPSIDIGEVTFKKDVLSDDVQDFLYYYSNNDNIKLAGYPFLISLSEDKISYKEVILDLTIYYKGNNGED